MASDGYVLRRAIWASPLLLVAVVSFLGMDLQHIKDLLEPLLLRDVITWPQGSIPILPKFHHVKFLDDLWRGSTIAFAPATIGFDEVAWWELLHFLLDDGVVYAIWLFEASKPAAARTPAYLALPFAFIFQQLGIGTVAPIYYILHFSLTPPAWELRKLPARSLLPTDTTLVASLIFLLSHVPVLLMFYSPSNESRHYWVWAWQMFPIWVAIAYALLVRLPVGSFSKAVPLPLLLVALAAPSCFTWLRLITSCPYPLRIVLIPELASKESFIPAIRRTFQFDEVCSICATVGWLSLQIMDARQITQQSGTFLENAVAFAVSFLAGLLAMLGLGPGAVYAGMWALKEKMIRGSF